MAGLRLLADRTGGRAALFMKGEEALAHIDRTSRSQYVLGYYPTNGEQNGRYRHITVKVTRPGLTALYRNGYFARQLLVPTDRRQFMAFSRILAAGSYPGPIRDIGVSVDATRDASTGEVRVAVSVKPDRIRVVERDGRQFVELDVALFNGDTRDRLISQLWQRIDLNLSAAEMSTAISNDIQYTMRFTPQRTPANVKVVVYDHVSDLIGTAAAPVR